VEGCALAVISAAFPTIREVNHDGRKILLAFPRLPNIILLADGQRIQNFAENRPQ